MDAVVVEVAPLLLTVVRTLRTPARLTVALEDLLRWHLQIHPEPSCLHGVGDALFRTLESFAGDLWIAVEPIATAAVAEIAARIVRELQATSTSLILPIWLPVFGDLQETSLARLLHIIHMFRASGMITLVRDNRKLQLAFEDGQCGVYSDSSHHDKRRMMRCFSWPDGQFRLKLGALVSENTLRSFGEPAWVIYRGVTEQVPPYIAAGRLAPHMGRYAVTRAHAQPVLDRMGRPRQLRQLCEACDGSRTLEEALGANPPGELILAAYYAIETDLIITSADGPMELPPLIDYAMVSPPAGVGMNANSDIPFLPPTDESLGPLGPMSSGNGLSTRPPSSGIRRSASELAIRRGRNISKTQATPKTEDILLERSTDFDLDADIDGTFRHEGSAAPLAQNLEEKRSGPEEGLATAGPGRHGHADRDRRGTPGRGSPMAPGEAVAGASPRIETAKPEQAAARFFHRGWRLLEAEAYLDAAAEFSRAMEVHPEHPRYQAWYAWASFLHTPHGVNSLIRDLLAISGPGAEALDVHLVLGRIYKRLGETDKAIAEFTMASVISPECPEAIREIRRFEAAGDGEHNSWSKRRGPNTEDF